jgi:hypothetical protein
MELAAIVVALRDRVKAAGSEARDIPYARSDTSFGNKGTSNFMILMPLFDLNFLTELLQVM